jgi:alkylation response protein AidB-like acyl-CoA dehydrogenase
MADFAPPVAEQILALQVNAGIAELSTHERFAAATPETVEAIVDGIGQFAACEWAPLNRLGDLEGARLVEGTVKLPAGFAEAYRAYVAAGWNSIAAPEQFGGQGMPFALACCVLESLGASNLAFSLLPMLTLGAIEALHKHGSAAQQAFYVPKLISGKWPGTMNLTEPQAGSDVGALRTTATPITAGPHAGKYRIKGTKIFITWGDHTLAENVIQLVLARVPGAPSGSRGISLFIVPKFIVNRDGSLGERNDYRVVSLEHKMGIHASPTCVMSYGDSNACIGELVGAENDGLKLMFTMMNAARVNVGAQGIQLAERALQQAGAYASERVQSARAGSHDRKPVAIIEHPDVRRMLLRMRALTEAARALLYYTAGQIDRGSLGDTAAATRAELLVPLLKAWATDVGCEVTDLNIQVHGGMGFIEETGAAQHFRDARIAPIYEGTNGIQAADLVTRKLGLENGDAFAVLMADIGEDAADAPALASLAIDCSDTADWMRSDASLDDKLVGSVPFLAMCATAVAGWQLLRQARASTGPSRKAVIARYFLDHVVPEAAGLKFAATSGADLFYRLDAERLVG